jgi:hypothetical protein
MPLVCPICNSPALDLPRISDATGFHCPIDGKFKVADTIVPEDYTRQQWEIAAKESTATNEAGGMAYCQEWGL